MKKHEEIKVQNSYRQTKEQNPLTEQRESRLHTFQGYGLVGAADGLLHGEKPEEEEQSSVSQEHSSSRLQSTSLLPSRRPRAWVAALVVILDACCVSIS